MPEQNDQEQVQPDSVVQLPDGTEMPVEDAVSKWNDMLKGMNEAQQRASDLEKEVGEYRQWADPVRDAYNRDPQGFNEWWQQTYGSQEPQQSQPFDESRKELQNIREEMQLLKWKDQFAEIKNRGLDLTPEMQREIMQYMRRNPHIDDAAMVYRTLYFDQALEKAKKSATSETAGRIAENQSAYRQQPEGTDRAPKKEDVTELSPSERRERGIRDIAKAGLDKMFGG